MVKEFKKFSELEKMISEQENINDEFVKKHKKFFGIIDNINDNLFIAYRNIPEDDEIITYVFTDDKNYVNNFKFHTELFDEVDVALYECYDIDSDIGTQVPFHYVLYCVDVNTIR